MHQFNRGGEVSRRPERPDAHARAGGPGYLRGPEYPHLNARRLAYHESIAAPAPAPASVAEDRPESKEEQHAVVTLRTEFLDVQAKHAVVPIAFRETQRDFKRYAAVIAATSVEDVKVGDGEAFRDEKDLRSFVRWILRGAPGHKSKTAKA